MWMMIANSWQLCLLLFSSTQEMMPLFGVDLRKTVCICICVQYFLKYEAYADEIIENFCHHCQLHVFHGSICMISYSIMCRGYIAK